MRTNIKYSFVMQNISAIRVIVAVVLGALVMVSCNREKSTTVPESGAIEYDVYYSGSIRDHGIVGKMLPSKISGLYNKDGVCLNASAGLGVVKMRVVASVEDSFVAMDISGEKMIVPFSDLFTQEDYVKKDTAIVSSELVEMQEVAGWQSHQISSVCQSPWGTLKVDTYYVPMDGFDKKIKDSPVETIPGMITAIKINTGDSGIIIMLSDIQPKEVGASDFARPSGYTPVGRQEVDELMKEHLD